MKIISVHFPKAGGYSLVVQLRYMLGDSLLVDHDHNPLDPDAEQTVNELPPGTRMVHGHFRAACYDGVSDAFRFTFLRHPVENLLSIYFFWQTFRSQIPWHLKFLQARPAIEEFAQNGPIRRFMSEIYFGGYDMSRFDFVGFIESRSSDYRTLSDMIGLPLDAGIHLNQTESHREERAAIKSDAAMMRRLTSLLADDIRFFERQREVWS